MRMIMEARIVDDVSSKVIRLAEFGRLDGDLKQLGLNLVEGRDLVHEAQRAMVCAQTRFPTPRPAASRATNAGKSLQSQTPTGLADGSIASLSSARTGCH